MNDLQTVMERYDPAKENAQQLIKAFGAPFTEIGKILSDYQRDDSGDMIVTDNTIIVTDESDKASMKKARELRLELKRVRTTVENKRKELKEESLRTGKAIDGVAKYIKDTIKPVEEYLEVQEKYAETKEAERKLKLKIERIEKITPFCDDPYIYNVELMSESDFDKLRSDLIEAAELKAAQAAAYEREQVRLREEREAEELRIREENEVLRKQAQIREEEIQREREAHEAELRATKVEVKQSSTNATLNAINALRRFTQPNINNGLPMIDYQAVVEILEV